MLKKLLHATDILNQRVEELIGKGRRPRITAGRLLEALEDSGLTVEEVEPLMDLPEISSGRRGE